MEILVDVAVDFYGEIARTVEREGQRVALLYSLDAVGVRSDLIALDVLSDALHLYFHFPLELEFSH